MHPSPATVAALLVTVAAAILIALVAIAVRPALQDPVVTVQRAPGPEPRAHGRAPSARRTSRRRTGRRSARPASTPTATPTPVPAPEQAPQREAAVAPPPEAQPDPQPPAAVVETFYRALDARRFEDAWTLLSPAVHAAFGGFERWRDGYATTLSSSPRDIEVAKDGAVATIAHELVTEDRSSCGPVRRRFAVAWKLVLASDGWRAASLTGVERAGPEPACPERHDAARAAGGR